MRKREREWEREREREREGEMYVCENRFLSTRHAGCLSIYIDISGALQILELLNFSSGCQRNVRYNAIVVTSTQHDQDRKSPRRNEYNWLCFLSRKTRNISTTTSRSHFLSDCTIYFGTFTQNQNLTIREYDRHKFPLRLRRDFEKSVLYVMPLTVLLLMYSYMLILAFGMSTHFITA